MKVGRIVKSQQPDIHKKLKENYSRKKHKRGNKERLSFSDVMELMRHSSYKRHKGAIKQVK